MPEAHFDGTRHGGPPFQPWLSDPRSTGHCARARRTHRVPAVPARTQGSVEIVMEAVIFVGPTLPLEAARKQLDAMYCPPAAQGDVLRALANKPRLIGIIDGY